MFSSDGLRATRVILREIVFMQDQQTVRHDYDDDERDSVSLIDIVLTLWRGRWVILIVTLLAAASGYIWSTQKHAYRSQGFFQFGGPIPAPLGRENREAQNEKDKDKESERTRSSGIQLVDYKRYAAFYSTAERFADYVNEKHLETDPIANEMISNFGAVDRVQALIEPIFPFTKNDAKELMEQPKSGANTILGLHVAYQSSTPEAAQKAVDLLAHYAMDSITYFIYSDSLRYKEDELKTNLTRLDNVVITNKLLGGDYERKAAELRKIVDNNPRSNKDSEQVLFLNSDNSKYLPPSTLLRTTEVQAAEAREAIRKAQFDQDQTKLLLQYYDAAKALLNSTKSGETLLRGLEAVKAKVFADKNMKDDAVQQVYNALTVDNRTAMGLYLDKSRFIAGPSFSRKSTSRPLFMTGIGFLLGFLLSAGFLLLRAWWIENKVMFFK